MTAKDYVLQNFKNTVRIQKEDIGDKMGVPYPFTVPCISGVFDVMFYWDTYFTNKGLILGGKVDIAKSNCDNIAYFINRFGYMPNGTKLEFLGRSQPPYFALMVKDVFEETGDKVWLKLMVESIEKEHDFWMDNRSTENGLNRYYGNYDKSQCLAFLDVVKKRIKNLKSVDESVTGLHYFAEAESGWDFTPRFNGCCTDYNPIDLNCLLYAQEEFLSNAYQILGEKDKSKIYLSKANERSKKINDLCYDKKRGIYVDYDYKNDKLSEVSSVAGLMPYFVKIAPQTRKESALKLLKILEEDYGVSATEKTLSEYQWGYKNAWPPLHLITTVALYNYGFKDDAKRIAKKYVDLVEKNFEKTGGLWEKYNAVTGGIDAVSEYGTPQMMGWTAGVYLYLKAYLKEF